ncbi:hypothetical protein EJ04DRAFT_74497 [Polyplosphaeria fusca]|uniref:Uncharacterized protein n=1 Tax=Polyplosphaeria fusca TaxID=682080 RepID=A0A9P4QMS4_9PLEO|nr:hypothetical protein EJ04DRAFT_74497 [Polyplosphaeria fusca]
MSARPSNTRTSSMPSTGSPLSPRMESLAIPSQARRRAPPHHRQSSSSNAQSLRLPGLPRFHPANFTSAASSAAQTPRTGPNSPQPPLSPRAYQKQYSEAQRQMYMLQREMIAGAQRQGRSQTDKPTSPRLIPLGSPGPVTPLELEGEDYLTAVNNGETASTVDQLIREEARRRGETSPGHSPYVGGR